MAALPYTRKIPSWIIPVTGFIVLAAVCLVAILHMGHFAYTLDDPYIHLALAENIARGHYGVNMQEFSSPASSIIWPFLLMPFMQFSWAEYIPLILNIIFSILSIIVFNKTLDLIFKSVVAENAHRYDLLKTTTSLAFIFIANLLTLTFTGMEHVLQVCLSVCIVSGIIFLVEKGVFPNYAVLALILAPTVRYENLALSGCTILFLLYRKQYRKAVISAILIAFILIGFSLFLHSLELNLLPTSIMVKSRTAWQANKVFAVLKNFVANISSRQGSVLLGFLILLLRPAFQSKYRFPALIIIIVIIFQLNFGDITFSRYVNYLIAAGFLALLYFWSEGLKRWISTKKTIVSLAGILIILLAVGGNFLVETGLTPIGANNIYEQQYQMGRFVREFYKKPVAINDLGLVAFKNDNYVLDLWGLASKPAFDVRIKERKGMEVGDWMNEFTHKKNVKFAMIYDPWFPKIPKNWHKIAQLHVSKINISPAYGTVDFYSLSSAETPEIIQKLTAFKTTLPPGVRLDIIE